MRINIVRVLEEYGASSIEFIRSILCVRHDDLKITLHAMIVDRVVYVNSQNKYDLV